MLTRVDYSEVHDLAPDGLRIIFTYDLNEQDDVHDIFDFYEAEDVSCLLFLLQHSDAVHVLMEVRERMDITVH